MQQNSRGAPEQRSGKRKSIGKRKLSDQEEAAFRSQNSQQHPQQQQQATISELLSRNHTHSKGYPPQSPPSNKRPRLSSPSSHSRAPVSSQELQPPDKMYNFSNSEHRTGGAFAQSSPANTTVKPHFSNTSSRQSNFTPHTGAKRLVVKNLRTGSRLNQDSYFDKVWAQLDAALSAVFSGGKPEISLEELYKGAENVCRQGRAVVLTQRLQDRCRAHVSGSLRDELLAKAADGSNVDTLRAVIDAWNTWKSKLVTIRWIFYYLDQSFLLHSKEFPVIREMGLIQFRNHIFSDPVLQPKVLQGACDLVDADRNEDHAMMADSSLLRNAIELFHGLDVYTTSFEPLLLSESKRFFVSWAQRESSGYLATFVENGHNLIAREVKRCELFSLNRSTKQKLSELLDRVLVADQESVSEFNMYR